MNRLFSFGSLKLKLAPEVAVRENLSISITAPDFHELMERIISHYGLICRFVQEDRHVDQLPPARHGNSPSTRNRFILGNCWAQYRPDYWGFTALAVPLDAEFVWQKTKRTR